VKVRSWFTVRMLAELGPNVPLVSPSLTVKARPLNNWPALRGSANRLVRVMVMDPLPEVKAACALTGPSVTPAPAGVAAAP
jgi:hypothetical protein